MKTCLEKSEFSNQTQGTTEVWVKHQALLSLHLATMEKVKMKEFSNG
jgi:hypothetical protein